MPRFTDPPKKQGKKRKRKYSPWESIDNVLSSVSGEDSKAQEIRPKATQPLDQTEDQSEIRSSKNLDRTSDEPELAALGDNSSPTLDKEKSKIGDSRSSGKIKTQSSDTELRHKDQAQNSDTKIRHENKTQSSDTKMRDKVVEQSSGTEFRDKVPTQYSDTGLEHKNQTQSSDTELKHKDQTQSSDTVGTLCVGTPKKIKHSSDTVVTQFKHTTRHSSDTELKHKLVFESELINPFFGLRGAKKRIADFIYSTCIEKDVDTFLITYDVLGSATQTKPSSIKTTVKRLRDQDNLITLVAHGSGPGAKIEVGPKPDLIKSFANTKWGSDTELKHSSNTELRHNSDTRPDTNGSSSSSNLLNNKKTNTRADSELPADWKEIVTPENVKEIGFGLSQVKQLYNLHSLSPEDVQSSLDAFSYDLEMGEVKSRGSKLAFLMGILRNSGSYVSEAQVNQMREAIEANLRRQKEIEAFEKEQKLERLRKKAEEQFHKMSEEEQIELVPENQLARVGSKRHKNMVIHKILERDPEYSGEESNN